MITPSFSPTATERVLPKLALDFTTASLDSRVTFTRSLDTATVINSSGQIAPINANLPRFDYNLGTGGACKGLLIEESRINLFNNSLLAGAVAGSPGTAATNWTIGFGTGATTALATSIYGTLDGAQAITFSGTSVRMMYQQTINVTSGQQYALSAYLESVTGTIADFLYVTNGTATVTLNSFATSPSQPGRYTMLFTANGTGNCTVRVGIGTSGATSGSVAVTFSRPQVEAGSFSTSYIPTTTSGSATRNADVATMTGTNFSSWWSGNGSVTVSIGNITKTSYTTAVVLDDGSGLLGNAVMLQSNSANNKLDTVIYTSGAQTQINDTQSFSTTLTNASMAVNTNYVSYSTQGAATTVNTGTLSVPSLNRCVFGYEQRYGNFLNGCIKKFAYYSNVLIANEVQAFSK